MPDRRNTVIMDRRASPRVVVDTGEIRERRRAGRPRKADDEKLVPVTVWISSSRYDALDREAKADEKKLSEFLRDRIDPAISLQENQKPI